MALFKSVSHKSLCNTFQPWHFITWFTNKISGKIRYIWLLFTRQETSIYQHRSKEKTPWWCSHHCYDEDVNISTCICWIIMLNMLNINVFIYTLYNPGSRESRRDGNSRARVHTAGQSAGFKKNIMKMRNVNMTIVWTIGIKSVVPSRNRHHARFQGSGALLSRNSNRPVNFPWGR